MKKNPRIAIIGRPNVGKSTLFNRLSGRRTSIVDSTEGVTRDRIYASGEWLSTKFDIIDTGGFVDSNEDIFDKKIKEQISEAIKECDYIIFLVDGKNGLNPNDKHLSQLVRQSNKKYVLAVNKCDVPNQLENDILPFFNLGLNDPIGISALNGSGVGDVLDILLDGSYSSTTLLARKYASTVLPQPGGPVTKFTPPLDANSSSISFCSGSKLFLFKSAKVMF